MRLSAVFSPFTYPIYFFLATILAGTVLLMLPGSLNGASIDFVDALFTATSATCVTGLAVVDTGTHFSRMGQGVILSMIQLGGLGIMTYASLVFYLWRRKVTLTDRLAVGQSLMHDSTFSLGRFLVRLVAWTAALEGIGALLLHSFDPHGFTPWSAVFHSISAFCNAGFGLHADSLTQWRGNAGVNLTIMGLIVLGGLGFSVIVELEGWLTGHLPWRRRGQRRKPRLSWYARTVLAVSAFLIVGGAAAIYMAEVVGLDRGLSFSEGVLAAFFQSVTCRTAGFNTLDVGQLTTISLLVMTFLMFVGGSPGSCAGGVKTTTLRVLWAFAVSKIKGRQQPVVGRFAVDRETVARAVSLTLVAIFLVAFGTLWLVVSEGGDVPHPAARGLFLEILFEVVSAFGTVGLSMGITPTLSVSGKIVITLLMFVGRLGPIVFLTALGRLQEQPRYVWPEESMLIG
ncbi:cation transporter [Desulfovibrio sp. X2]|uniref:TrkH family potassium uptake protein n=1 Tax=Desulfovibrio sp. X2 TaxID=941449 RepID=UPI0003589941|nr:potassium transporter TrkG [Desulfovibrio sp. X2]EPR42343.1 cation transporter [Desulfovibrio sp. X2]